MGNKTMNTRVQNKHDLEVNWQKATNFKPLAGELIVYDAERDDDPIPEGREYSIARPRFKVGDGENFVNDLDFTDLVYQFNGLSDEEQDKARDSLGLAPLIAALTWDDEAEEWTCSVSLNEMLDALNAGISVRVVVNDWDYFIPISYTEYAIIFGSFSDDGFYSVIWIGEDYIYYGADIALVRYDDNGCLSSNEPVGRDHVATKGYVDNAIANTSGSGTKITLHIWEEND